jgi:hypothetical protein
LVWRSTALDSIARVNWRLCSRKFVVRFWSVWIDRLRRRAARKRVIRSVSAASFNAISRVNWSLALGERIVGSRCIWVDRFSTCIGVASFWQSVVRYRLLFRQGVVYLRLLARETLIGPRIAGLHVWVDVHVRIWVEVRVAGRTFWLSWKTTLGLAVFVWCHAVYSF